MIDISIHAPRGGSDLFVIPMYLFPFGFQSTLPVGGATLRALSVDISGEISIHAPRGGSDWRTHSDLYYQR